MLLKLVFVVLPASAACALAPSLGAQSPHATTVVLHGAELQLQLQRVCGRLPGCPIFGWSWGLPVAAVAAAFAAGWTSTKVASARGTVSSSHTRVAKGARWAAAAPIARRANPIATFETSMGSFKAEIFLDKMPITSSNFLDLCKTGFYDGVHFHRVIPGFMTQFGCPYARNTWDPRGGMGNPDGFSTFKLLDGSGKTIKRSPEGSIPDELIEQIGNEPGTLSMANKGGSCTGGSQFFINVNNNSFLNWWDSSSPAKHPVFGKVIEGYDIVKQISQVRTLFDKPLEPIMVNVVATEEQ